MPLSPMAGNTSPGAVLVCPTGGITQSKCASVLVVIALLVNVNAVEPLPCTSTYQVPGVRYGGAMITVPVPYSEVSQVLSGSRFWRTRTDGEPLIAVKSSFQPNTGAPLTTAGIVT